jgi:hypothetical protein
VVLVRALRGEKAVGVLAVISPALAAFGDRDVWNLRLRADLLAEGPGDWPSSITAD